MTIVVVRFVWNRLVPRISHNFCMIHYRKSSSSQFPDYRVIYRFPYIQTASTVNRLKLYQSISTSVLIPASMILKILGTISTDTATIVGVLGVTATITMYTVGFLCHNLVGYVYLKEDNQTVKISHVDFWGSRVDVDTKVTDICPLSDLPVTTTDPLYLNLQRYSTNNKLKLNMTLGRITDIEKFQIVFGEHELKV